MLLGITGLFMFGSCVYDSLPSSVTGCDFKDISYAKQVQPIITTRCATANCHSTEHARMTGLQIISNYKEVIRDTSNIKQVILSGYMPRGEPLTNCEIQTLANWISEGGKNN